MRAQPIVKCTRRVFCKCETICDLYYPFKVGCPRAPVCEQIINVSHSPYKDILFFWISSVQKLQAYTIKCGTAIQFMKFFFKLFFKNIKSVLLSIVLFQVVRGDNLL